MNSEHAIGNQLNEDSAGTTRRHLMQGAIALSAGLLTARTARAAGDVQSAYPQLKGNIKQSMVHWCYKNHFSVEQMAQFAANFGVPSIELIDPKHWHVLKKHGLTCAIAGSHGFKKGPNDPANWGETKEILTERINQAADFGCPSVITFTGMAGDITAEKGADNCVKFFKEMMPLAEKKKVNLCLEMLNTRDASHPMKGHPGYQGNHTEYCIDIIKRVGSKRMQLLFDIYHVQIMDGDVIRRIKQHHEYIGHIHTAGNPGRGELDANQEISYPAIMKALLEVKYKGFVGQEFIPTRNPEVGRQEAFLLCDV